MEGDLALKATSQIFHDCLRKSDIVARMGGDEFTVIVIDSYSENLDLIKNKLCKNLNEFNLKSGKPYKLSISIGAAEFDHKNPLTFSEIMAIADSELYKDKMKKKAGQRIEPC